MADGFLAPTGKFYPKTENFHAQTARAILGPDGQTDEPIQELLRRGYILFVGFHKPGEPENLHADMDYVLGGPGYPATEGQKAWIAEHTEELSRKQQFDINNDETTFEKLLHQQCPHVSLVQGAVPKRKRVTSGAMHRARKPTGAARPRAPLWYASSAAGSTRSARRAGGLKPQSRTGPRRNVRK